MAKAILEFDLDNPEDRKAHLRATHSTEMAIILFELTHNISNKLINDKSNNHYIKGVHETIVEVYKLLNESNINLENIID